MILIAPGDSLASITPRSLYENLGKTAAEVCEIAGLGRRVFFAYLAKKHHSLESYLRKGFKLSVRFCPNSPLSDLLLKCIQARSFRHHLRLLQTEGDRCSEELALSLPGGILKSLQGNIMVGWKISRNVKILHWIHQVYL